MCYSARVRQNLKHLSRKYEAEVDYEAFEELYRRRAEGEDIKMSRDLQRNFQNPETDIERRTAAYITQYLQAKRSEWEKAVFAQKRRVAEAEESLAKRETKKSPGRHPYWHQEGARVSRSPGRPTSNGTQQRRCADLSTQLRACADFTNKTTGSSSRCATPAGWPASRPTWRSGSPVPTTHVAIASMDYWRAVYGRKHAVMVISGFYENVPEHLYQHRELAPDEKEKNLVLEFDPKPARDMLVACLWDHWIKPGEPGLDSFAAITDEPTPRSCSDRASAHDYHDSGTVPLRLALTESTQ